MRFGTPIENLYVFTFSLSLIANMNDKSKLVLYVKLTKFDYLISF